MNRRISYTQASKAYAAHGSQLQRQTGHFEEALDHVLRTEGGFSNHPLDRGNKMGRRTAYGITQVAYNAYRTRKGLPRRNTREITQHEVRQLYYEDYWLASKADRLPRQLALVHFDAAVNHGVFKANKLLQRALGVHEDGILGPATMRAVKRYSAKYVAERYLSIRKEFYLQIVKNTPSQKVFLRGWLARLERLREIHR